MATKKVRNTEEDTNRTEATPTVVAQASRDEEQAESGNDEGEDDEPDISAQKDSDDGDPPSIEETVTLDDPEDQFKEIDDPRERIAKKFQKEQRNYEADDQLQVESDGKPDIIQGEPENEPDLVEIKINQEVRHVERAKIDKMSGDTHEQRVVAYQKQLAVDDGFQRNAQQKASLDTREANLAERERLLEEQPALPTLDAQPDKPTPADPPTTGDQTIEQLANEYQESVYDGDEAAPILLAKLVKAAASQQKPVEIDLDKLKQEAADEFEKRERGKKVVKASRALLSDHPELDRKKPDFDQRLYTAVNDETSVVERQNPDFDPQEVIELAWRRVSKWRGGHKTDSMSDKLDSKRNMNRPKVGTGRFVKPAPPAAQTGSDYVQSLKVNRGQA